MVKDVKKAIANLANRKAGWVTRRDAAEALGAAVSEATTALRAHADDSDSDVQSAVKRALGTASAALAGVKAQGSQEGYSLITLTTLLVAALSGISPTGGTGDIFNLFLALFLMQLIKSGLNLLRVSSFIRELVPAALLIGLISLEYNLNLLNERRLNRRVLQKNLAKESKD